VRSVTKASERYKYGTRKADMMKRNALGAVFALIATCIAGALQASHADDQGDCIKNGPSLLVSEPSKTVEACKRLAQLGDPRAQATLGYVYMTGVEGIQIDYAEAAKWLQLAAAQGQPFAEYRLGQLYNAGVGVSHDSQLARKWLKSAVAHGQKDAEYALNQMIPDGAGLVSEPLMSRPVTVLEFVLGAREVISPRM